MLWRSAPSTNYYHVCWKQQGAHNQRLKQDKLSSAWQGNAIGNGFLHHRSFLFQMLLIHFMNALRMTDCEMNQWPLLLWLLLVAVLIKVALVSSSHGLTHCQVCILLTSAVVTFSAGPRSSHDPILHELRSFEAIVSLKIKHQLHAPDFCLPEILVSGVFLYLTC